MKKLLSLAVALTLTAGCARQAKTVQQEPAPAIVSSPTPSPVKDPAVGEDTAVEKDSPPEFRGIDFKNRSYALNSHTKIRLKDGEYEYREGSGGVTFELDDVNYADLTGDGKKEAVVELFQLSCGGSCDGGTNFFLFYSIKRGQLSLLTRLEIGSFAYDCGLKSFSLKSRTLALETFRACRFTGSAFRPSHNDPNEEGGKLSTNRYTQFSLHFNGRRFVQRARKVLSYPDVYDFRGHERKIEISNE
jgi:hypothetical protein